MSFELMVLIKVTVIFGVTGLAVLAMTKSSASTRHAILCVGFLAALIVPFGLTTLPVIEIPFLAPVPIEEVSPALPSEIDPLQVLVAPVLPGTPSPSSSGAQPVFTATDDGTMAWEWRRLFGWAWPLGTLLALLRMLSSNWEVLRLKRMPTSVVAKEIAAEIDVLKCDLSVGTYVDVRISTHDVPPMTCGLIRQMILLPSVAAQWTVERRRVVLAHEFAHAKRHDGLIQAFVDVVCALYWFHPAVWFAARRVRLERERACDDVVLSLGVDADKYVDHLLGIAREINSKFSLAAASMAHPWQLESRLCAILDSKRPRQTLTSFKKALLFSSGVVAAGGLSSLEPVASARPELFIVQSDIVSPQGVAKLEGTVVDTRTGRPVVMAEVRVTTGLTAFPEANVPLGLGLPPRPSPRPAYSATTDAAGRFIIQDIRPGTYRVGVSAMGYANHEVGQRSPDRPASVPVNILPDSSMPLTVRLTPGATLSGRITNDARQPLHGVPVYLLQQRLNANGDRRLTATRMTTTSDSGTYEFAYIPPGPYYILAGRGASLSSQNRNQPLYGWAYYPGRADAGLATRIDAPPGASLGGLDLFVQPQQPRRIRGTVIDFRTGKPPENAHIFLRTYSPFDPGDIGGTLPYDPVTGRFEATGLIDGVYAVGVDLGAPSFREPRIFYSHSRDGWRAVEISGADVDDLVIHVPRSGYIRGRIALEGNHTLSEVYSAQTSPRSAGLPLQSEPSRPRIALEPTSSRQQAPINGPVDMSDGTFEVPNAISGKYRLNVVDLPGGYYVKAVRLNGATTSTPLLEFHPDERTQLDITIAPGAGEVRGVVLNDRQEPLAGAAGLLLPDPLPSEIGYFRTFSVDQSGSFTLSSIRPGEYRIYLFDGLYSGEFPEEDLLRRSTTRSTRVVIAEGTKLSITAGAVQTESTR